jgi:hypothetical protein
MKEIDIIKVRVENSNQIIMKKIYKLIKITLVILLAMCAYFIKTERLE